MSRPKEEETKKEGNVLLHKREEKGITWVSNNECSRAESIGALNSVARHN